MKERYKISKCDDGRWMVHDDGDVICYAAQGSEQQKAQHIADALNLYSHQFKGIVTFYMRLRAGMKPGEALKKPVRKYQKKEG